MWMLTAKAYYLFGIKMSISNYLGSLSLIFFLSIAVVVNIVESAKCIVNYLKNKQWL